MNSAAHKKWQRILAAGLIVGLGGFGLAACSSDDATTEETTNAAAPPETTSAVAEQQDLTFENAYVRAMDENADMTAAFGELHNHTDQDIAVVTISSSIAAESYELHEVVDGVMQVKEGGFVIPANSTLVLEPGSDHFMFMGVSEPIPAGSEVTITLNLDNGESLVFNDVAVRTIGAGDEDYGDMVGDMGEEMGEGMG